MTAPSSILLLGGVRSGKSSLAVSIGRRWSGPVVFVATARPDDDDMAARIDRHRRERPAGWTVLERPELGVDDLSSPDAGLTIVDCITVLVANLMLAGLDDTTVLKHMKELGSVLAARPSVVVSNEVGMGVHPATDLGRRYRDLLGGVNRELASSLHASYLVMAGQALRLGDSTDILRTMGDRQ